MAEKIYRHDFFETTSVTDFVITPDGDPPRGYPKNAHPDEYSPEPFARGFAARRESFLRHCLKNPAGKTIKGYYLELARLYKNRGPVHRGAILGALGYIDERRDCADFVMLGIVRLLYQFRSSRLLDKKLIGRAERSLLDFKYWPDEPGIDSMCTWTENHQIMFSANEYLAGQLFPEKVFSNSGMTGLEKMERARKRIMRWTELRFRTGFSEWLSHVYYDEDITALLNLADFARDPVLSRRAKIVLDLLFLDMALHSFKGVFGSTHGRSYAKEKRFSLSESTSDTSKLAFGMGRFSMADNMSAVALALSTRYRLPRALFEIAAHAGEMEVRQRMGILIREAGRWGLDPDREEDAMTLLSLEAYAHPRTIMTVMRLFDSFRWWENSFFSMFKSKKRLLDFARRLHLLPLVATIFEKDITRNTREEVNIYTYKTPHYMLSSAQDYRKGYGGDQQHIWQATLAPDAVCFTTHPGSLENTSTGYWVGSGSLPRVAQIKNLLIAAYNISAMPGIYLTNRLFYTHAYFPVDKFDAVEERNGWIFARKGEGYLALYSQNGFALREDGEDAGRELVAEGRRNIWICEMGDVDSSGGFEDFIERVASASLDFSGLHVSFDSPSQGPVEFGWRGPLLHEGSRVRLKGFPRYECPFVRADFPPEEIAIAINKETLRLNLNKGIRETSSEA